MPMDLDKAAKALNTSKEMLLRWARQGAIPAVEKDGEYHFERKTLEMWAARRHMPVQFDSGSRISSTDIERRVSIFEAMKRGGVYFGIEGGDVGIVLQNAVQTMSLPADIDKAELLRRLKERESLASTGIGHGVAIPHPRHPLDNIPAGGIICTCFLANKIDFGSVDGKPVLVLFIMMSPGTKRHLEMLARLTFCLHDSDFLPNLEACTSESEFFELVSRVEEKFQKHAG